MASQIQQNAPLDGNNNNNLKLQEIEASTKFLQQQKLTTSQMTILRISVCVVAAICYWESEILQNYVDSSYEYLKDKFWFRTVYFETVIVVIYTVNVIKIFQVLVQRGYFSEYKIESHAGDIPSESVPVIIKKMFVYISPLATLDTFHVKKYHGVDENEIKERQKYWIQTTRVLPEHSPPLYDIITHIVIALVIYDALFFVIHYSLHKNATLYRNLHKEHHTHDILQAKVTDEQHWLERITFVLCANAGLKVQGAHPYTRLIFIFVFVGILINNHSGYDFPWSYDKIIPFKIAAGSRQHYEHHVKGKRNYQFVLTYMDNILERIEKRRRGMKQL